ncbi:hypothetical protein GCM10027191_10170 [Novilysobacter erysipheiresistens]
MQSGGAVAQLQPRAAAVDAELHERVVRVVDQAGTAVGSMAERVHALAKDQVVTFAVRKSQSEGIHAAAI